MNIKEFSSSGARFAKKWSGIQDFANGYTAYQKKDYHSLAKNLAIGLLKVGAIGAALYGAYHWTFSKPVLLSGAANQKPTPETKKTSPQPPTEQQIKALAEEEKSEIKSMEERVDNLYEKYGNSHQWPDDDFQFALWQPSSDTKASAAFITRLLAQAIPRKDGHIITQIKRECLGSGDTQPCLAALKSFVGDSTTPPTEQTLTEAAWINADCQVGLSEPIQNKYCTQAYEEVKRQAIALKCLLSVKGILELMARAPEISEKDVPFAEKAVALYTEELRKKESIVVEHHVKGDKWDQGMERLAHFDELRHALNNFGLVLAQVCLKVKNSEPCREFVGYFVQLLLKNDLLNAVLFLQKKVPSGALTESYLIDAVDKLANEGHWGKAAKIITALPNSPATQKAIEKTVDLALSNLSGTEEVLKLYQVAKTWITPSEIKNEKQLMRMIEALLNNNTSSLREMAAVLVTKLIQRKSSDPIDYSINASEIDRQEDLPRGARGLSFSSTGHETNVYELKKPPLDSYYSGIYGTSWKEKLRAVGYTIE